MENEILVAVLPEELKFGNVCIGFTYRLTVTLLNTAARPQRFKVTCRPRLNKSTKQSELPKFNEIKAIFQSSPVAPGLSTVVYLEMKAEHTGTSKFDMKVVQSLSSKELKFPVTAHILSLDSFKCISQALAAKKESIYSPGVRPIPQPTVPGSAAASPPNSPTKPSSPPDNASPTGSQGTIVSQFLEPTVNPKFLRPIASAASLITESLLEDADIEELLLIPMQFNQYWDPFESMLKSDPQLSRVGNAMVVSHKLLLLLLRMMMTLLLLWLLLWLFRL